MPTALPASLFGLDAIHDPIEAHDRKQLEQLCRNTTRPALSDERVQINATGQVGLKLKTVWRDGTTHLLMRPPEFMP